MRYRTLLIMALLSLLLPLAPAAAQTTTPPPETGAFDKLSPGGQKIANAIFEAQIQPTTPPNGTGTTTGPAGTTGTTGVTNATTPEPLTLDQIAQRKLDGQGWGVIFKDLKAQGLVTTKNLGQTVSAYNHNHKLHSGTGTVTTASGRTIRDGQDGSVDASGRRGGDEGRGGHGGKGGNDAGGSHASYSKSGRGSSSSQGGGIGGGHQGGGNAYGRMK
ncbi:MAG: hypothetical protein ACRELS_21375 [Candidatus Rokuibacteriota bacterium]